MASSFCAASQEGTASPSTQQVAWTTATTESDGSAVPFTLAASWLRLAAVTAATATANTNNEILFKHAGSRDEASAGEVEKLLRAGADATAMTPDGETPLHLSCIYGSARKVRALLEHGANPNARASKNPASLDMTPLTWCDVRATPCTIQ